MICIACSCENHRSNIACDVCGAPLTANSGWALGGSAVVRDEFVETRINELERRLASLADQVESDPRRLAAAEALFDRDMQAPQERQADKSGAESATPPNLGPPAIRVGTLQAIFGDQAGARIETVAGSRPAPGSAALKLARHSVRNDCGDLRPDATAAVWAALDAGAAMVRISGAPGAGATTLLERLAGDASRHGFADGSLLLTHTRGGAGDIAQNIAAQLRPSGERRYYSAVELQSDFGDVRALVLLDRAQLSRDDAAQLGQSFPSLRFVVVQSPALDGVPTVTLGALPTQIALRLVADVYARAIDDDNRRVAIDLLTTVGRLPGPIRLVAVAARALQHSFVSLLLRFETGAAVVRALVAVSSLLEQRILATLVLAGAPLSASDIGFIVDCGEVGAALEQLVERELVSAGENGSFALPAYVAALVPPLAADDTAFGRTIDVYCAALDSSAIVPVSDAQIVAAQTLLELGADRSQWPFVLALGPRVADAVAVRGAFGAWERVLHLIDVAATHGDQSNSRDRAQHDLAVRATLLGDYTTAIALLKAVIASREATGDQAGTTSAHRILALANHGWAQAQRTALTALPTVAPKTPVRQPSATSDHPPTAAAPGQQHTAPEPVFAVAAARRPVRRETVLLFAAAAVMVAVIAFVLRPGHSTALAITRFTSNPVTVVGGRSARLCVNATEAAVVEIFPNAGRLSGEGEQCVTIRPSMTTTYVAIATAPDGRQVRSAVTVDVEHRTTGQVQIAAFFASPARIQAGRSTRLCYTVTGANRLHMTPRIGKLTRLRACETVTLRQPKRYTYRLLATNERGNVAVRQIHVDVLASAISAASVTRNNALNSRLTQQAVYQFDATPSVVERGQATSLCAGVERGARGYLTHVGSLQSGVTRCFRVQPRRTTTYRLYVALHHQSAVQSLIVAVRPAGRHDIARLGHR